MLHGIHSMEQPYIATRDLSSRSNKRTPSSVESAIFSCSICGEFQTEPKLLSCLHSFCKVCLPMCVHEDGRHIICPTCQEITKINQNRGLDGIPKNTLIEETLTYWLKQREIEQKQVSEPRNTRATGKLNSVVPTDATVPNCVILPRGPHQALLACIQ